MGGVHRKAHRVMWEMKNGEVPKGKELHHKCEEKRCVNPDHLECLTRREHVEKHPGMAVWSNGWKTHCKHGHPYNAENTIWRRNGARDCRICNALREAKWRKKHKGVAIMAEEEVEQRVVTGVEIDW